MQPFSIVARAAPSVAEILIFGDIGESWDGQSVAAREFVNELTAVKASRLVVRVNSYGGSVADGLAIYNAIRRHPAPVKEVSIEGVAVSVASLIAMAGDTVAMALNSLMMIHAPWISTIGNAAELRDMADVLDRYAEAMVSAYVRKSGRPADEIRALLSDGLDHWFGPDEALAAGFADSITDALPIAASLLSFNRYHPPEKFSTMNPSTAQTQTAPQDAACEAALAADKSRRDEIKMRFKAFMARDGVQEIYDAAIDDPKTTADMAGQKLLAKLAEGVEPLNPRGYALRMSDTPYNDRRDAMFMAGARDALLIRAGVKVSDPAPAAAELRRMSVASMAETCLRLAGRSTEMMSKSQIVAEAFAMRRAYAGHTTSDFPTLLSNSVHKSLMIGYAEAVSTFRAWTDETEIQDFRPTTLTRLSAAPGLLPVLEGGEIREGSFDEETNAPIQLRKFARIFTITREAIVNDDLGAFSTLPQAFGASAARLEADVTYGLLLGNPALEDGLPLFHASRGNVDGTAAPLSVATLGKARAAMRKQRSNGGYVDILPRVLLVPVSLETAAEQLIASIVDPGKNNDTAQPEWIKRLIVVADPRLDADSETAWYLVGEPRQQSGIVRAYLQGEPRPAFEEDIGFEIEGMRIKARLEFAAAVADYRGLFRSVGQ